MRTWLFSSQLFRQKNYICKTLNASWYWTVFESIVSSKNCIRRAIDHQIFFRCTICSKLDHSTWLFESIISIEKIAFTKRSTLNASRYLILIWSFRQLYHQKNCICRVIDFQIRFRWTICSLFDFLSMSMFYNWYVNSINEVFFFFLAWIFSQRNETSIHRRYLIENYARLKTSWFFVHWFVSLIYVEKHWQNFERWYFHWVIHVLQIDCRHEI